MPFEPKTWVDAPEGYVQGDTVPPGATPTDAAALNDLEARVEAALLELAGSGGAAATAQALLFEPLAGVSVYGGQAIAEPRIVPGSSGTLLTSDNIADFVAANGDDKLVFARECLIFGTLSLDADNDVTDGAAAWVSVGPLDDSQVIVSTVPIAVGESHADAGPVFVWRPSVGDTLNVTFENQDSVANAFYLVLKLWLVG